MDNMTIFDMLYPTFKTDKPIRLIELFAGVGSQAMALRDLGAEFEHYRVVEFDKYAIASYNAIHGTDFQTMDITQVFGDDLAITDTDKYCYIMTYSFPCQDLSVAGKMQGMAKGSGTRSGLLWEVERLLGEVKELPQVLLMENVPQVISDANIADFHKWQDFLESKGYTNYVEILNAKDFGVAQNRERCFMVSLLGKWNYKFPTPIPLNKTMKDYLEDEVDEKYYINSEKAQKLIQQLMESGQLEGCVGNINPSSNGINGNVYGSDGTSPTITTNKGESPKICTNISKQGAILSEYGTKLEKFTDCAMTIMARDYKGFGKQSTNGVIDEKVKQIGNYETESTWDNPQTGRVYSADGNTCSGGDRQPKIVEAIVRSTGRNPQNPSDRTPGNHVEQRLEPNSQGICNTLTSVQKDSLVLEPIGGIYINASADFQRGILKEMSRCLKANQNDAGVVEKVKIKQATKDGYIECKLGGVADLSYPTSKTRRGRVQDNGDTCPTLTATETGICRIETPYRIRKLTPKECWRLMDFTDEDYEKAEAVNSNTQLYKQAGNSIVKAVLMAIFKQML